MRAEPTSAMTEHTGHAAGLSKLNSVSIEVDVLLGELGNRTAETIELAERLPGRVLRYP